MTSSTLRIKNPRFQVLDSLPYGPVTSCLYIASAGTVTKVGYTANILDRAKSLVIELEKRSGANFYAIEAFPGAGAAYEESGLLELMRQHFELDSGNEYFACTFEEAYDLVAQYCRSVRVKRIEKKEAFLASYIQEAQDHIDELKDYVKDDVTYSSRKENAK